MYDVCPPLNGVLDPIKAIAFYLPQFHPIPENDLFWGTGFTEWRNVVRARPRFKGHDQPQIPADLGFYDLRLPEVQAAQANLARKAGLHGFCYYHYWFSGRRVLNGPFDQVLRQGQPDFPFMLCWANENWTRAWDGGAQHILLRQTYSDGDTVNHARSLIPAFSDPRYIRIENRPAFAVYNIDDIPNPDQWACVFRETCIREGIEPYLIRVERYLDQDQRPPMDIGFDAALEFQPFSRNFRRWQKTRPDLKTNLGLRIKHRIRREAERFVDLDTQFNLRAFVEFDIAQDLPSYRQFPGVCPSWDNSSRRPPGSAIIFRNTSPELFAKWLTAKVKKISAQSGTGHVFINAWNEWGEGNHLEPCLTHGSAWLDALSQALSDAPIYTQ